MVLIEQKYTTKILSNTFYLWRFNTTFVLRFFFALQSKLNHHGSYLTVLTYHFIINTKAEQTFHLMAKL